jgi:DNA repair protein RecO (recombination protein O)
MDERTTGLILRTRPLTETSVIVHWITPDLGRLATVAKGARRPKSPFRGKLDLFYLADFSFARSRRSELHTLREVVLRETHSALREDLARLRQASYCAALIEQTTETESPIPNIFRLSLDVIAHLLRHAPNPMTIFAFEMKLLKEQGLAPRLEEAGASPGSRQLLARLADLDWVALVNLRASAAQVIEMRQFLHGFLIYHLGRIPKGRGNALGLK